MITCFLFLDALLALSAGVDGEIAGVFRMIEVFRFGLAGIGRAFLLDGGALLGGFFIFARDGGKLIAALLLNRIGALVVDLFRGLEFFLDLLELLVDLGVDGGEVFLVRLL